MFLVWDSRILFDKVVYAFNQYVIYQSRLHLKNIVSSYKMFLDLHLYFYHENKKY